MVGAVHVAPPERFQHPPPPLPPPPPPAVRLSDRVQPYERWAHAEAVMAKATAVARRVVKTVAPGKMAAGLLSGPTGPGPLLPPRIPPPPQAFRTRGPLRGRTPPRPLSARATPRSCTPPPPEENSPTPLKRQASRTTPRTASSRTLARSGAALEGTTQAPPRIRVGGYVPPPTTVLYASTLTHARTPPPPLNVRAATAAREHAAKHINFTKEYFYAFPDIIKEPAIALNSLEERSRRREIVISDLSSQDVLVSPPAKMSSKIPIPNSENASSAPAVITHSAKVPSCTVLRDPKEVLRNAYKHYIKKAKNIRDAQGLMLDLAWREQERDGFRERGVNEMERLRRKLRGTTELEDDAITVDGDSVTQKPLTTCYQFTNNKICPSDRSNISSQESRLHRPPTQHSHAERPPAKGALKLGVPKDSDLRISGRKKSVHIVTPPKTPLRASSSTIGIDSSMLDPPKTKRLMTPLQATPPRYQTHSFGKDVREEDVDQILQMASRDRRPTTGDAFRVTEHKSTRRRTPVSPRSSRSYSRRWSPSPQYTTLPLSRPNNPPPPHPVSPSAMAAPPSTTPLQPLRRPVTPRLVLPSTTTMRRNTYYSATRSRYNNKVRDR